MDKLEKQCRLLAKEKLVLIRNNTQSINLHYKVTTTMAKKVCHTWEQVLDFLNKFERK